MSHRSTTIAIALATALTWGVWDVSVWRAGHTEATFSTVLRDLLLSHPMLTFSAGVLIGHIFWPIR